MDFARPVQSVIPGAQGRILAVLAATTAELNLRTIARLSGVSVAQASRVLPVLVELGMVERREAPPSALFRFVQEHVASRAVMALAGVRQSVLEDIGKTAAELSPPPVSVIVFGSLARGEADARSDLDFVVVRPRGTPEGDEAWTSGIDSWREHIRRVVGNRVELIEVSVEEVGRLLEARKPLWVDVVRDGIVVFGRRISDLRRRRSA